MSQAFTKAMARNIFYGGTVFFFLLFLGLTFDTMSGLPERDNRAALEGPGGEVVALGKKVWEENNCVGCHTLLGEGAYYAPELGNVTQLMGGTAGVIAWIKAQPTGIPGRRQMPNYNLSDEELNAVAEFLKYSSEINTGNWPPNIQG